MALRLKLHELEKMAREAGYADYKSLLYELYVTQRMSLTELSTRCLISELRIRKHLRRFGIPRRGRGGPNNVKVVITDVLLQEIAKDGVPAVAARLGIEPAILYLRLKSVRY